MIIARYDVILDQSEHAHLYNHAARGDYNTEALIFNVAAARFLDVSEEKTKKVKENAVALIIT